MEVVENKHFAVVVEATAGSDLDKAPVVVAVVAAAAAAAVVVVEAGLETGSSIGEVPGEKHLCTGSRCVRDPDTAANGLGLC